MGKTVVHKEFQFQLSSISPSPIHKTQQQISKTVYVHMWLCSDFVLHNLMSVQICHSTTNCNFKPHHIQNLTAFHSLTLCKLAETLFSIATAFSTAVASHAYYRQISVHFQDANSMNSETVLHCVTFTDAINTL